jgi:malto-oligosyltrehalose synthase/4-alpha-glucanotransferase
MLNLVSTYRIQFHKDFNFGQLKNILAYLQKLGIGTLYASPVFEAVPGSMHGYDVINSNGINPEIGTTDQLKEISAALRSNDIGWLQDIVPNHMGYHSKNEWLMDVLENGKDSKYATFFDIDHEQKIMAPFLGASLDEAIVNNELKVVHISGKPKLQYYDSYYPLKTGKKIDAHISGDALKQLLEEQHYRLCCWKETDTNINYRRFFTINSLICLNIHDNDAFDTYHRSIGELTREGIFTGLRVDHIDGLYDPTAYLEKLRELAGEETHITVEKILQPRESLPAYWKVQGNTGYDFLALVNNLFTRGDSAAAFTEFYQQLAADYSPVELHIQDKKAHILCNHMQGELDNLYHLFKESGLVSKRSFASIRQDDLREAIAEFLINCPVYRYYGNTLPLDEEEMNALQQVFNKIRSQDPDLQQAVTLLEQAILHNPRQGDNERNQRAAHFYKRCMQFTGPLMAKGVEDTLMYTWNRFIGHNEVGDQPSSFGISTREFHHAMNERQQRWPYSLNATSTHDTKRGEDVRARLNVLTDLPELWFDKVTEWRSQNKDAKGIVDDNDEYFIYQSLTGSWPFPGEEAGDFENRLNEYLQKAFREAKTHSNWTEPNTEYESAVKEFVSRLLQTDSPFLNSFNELHRQIADHGIINSFSQLVLKFTCPGIPDVYQGCEGWDLSFVDPDNRRPVNYEQRLQWLEEVYGMDAGDFNHLWEERYSGKIKLWLTQQLLTLRKQQPELFAQGEYIPLQAEGTYKDNIIAFARRYRRDIYLVALPLHTAAICREQNCGPLRIDWKDTRIILPYDVNAEWDDIFTEAKESYKGEVKINGAFANTPFLVWKGKLAVKERSAGILLHLTSLPSPYGIGDMGPEAKVFAEFLYRSKQRYWQLLPLNPTEAGQGHSPYSAVSAMAGNTLLISPDILIREGLLDHKELNSHHIPNEGKVNYAEVVRSREELLNKAFWSYLKSDNRTGFEEFCTRESYWLDDFALFTLLKQLNQGMPWFQWKDEYKLRDAKALQTLQEDHPDEIYRIKWLQYIFSKQWRGLKAYCNERNISLIGDLPIYVSYDSADVWSNREIFAIDEDGNATGVAGVPPDAFSDDGQLWGMPVFKWDVLKERNYDWWIDRIKRNRELFDLIRIDHFRAFSAYWEVPAGEPTARNGEWKPGPGSDFFTAIQNELGELPFIAEDLGDVDDTVFALRDEFILPGMKVLQFAFGNDLPRSVHIPHNHSGNFIVYTGTHDNNTTRGWYKTADEQTKRSLEEYAGKPVNEDEVHWVLAKMAYASVARIVILPMQDVLNLDETARMNIPASAENNWAWRLVPGQADRPMEDKLRHLVYLYNR